MGITGRRFAAPLPFLDADPISQPVLLAKMDRFFTIQHPKVL
jgi:hypothetical protein